MEGCMDIGFSEPNCRRDKLWIVHVPRLMNWKLTALGIRAQLDKNIFVGVDTSLENRQRRVPRFLGHNQVPLLWRQGYVWVRI